ETTESVHVVDDGASALDFLHQRGEYADAPRPDLILLDLHLSDPDGVAVLTELDDRPELRQIPVLVVTASAVAEDVVQAYELHANAYVQKPSDPAS
ncbi:response regulator, partial [Chryseobacterium gambrini]